MDEVVFSHVQHKGGVLPHFQVRMLKGDSFDNKCLGKEFVIFSWGSFFAFVMSTQNINFTQVQLRSQLQPSFAGRNL